MTTIAMATTAPLGQTPDEDGGLSLRNIAIGVGVGLLLIWLLQRPSKGRSSTSDRDLDIARQRGRAAAEYAVKVSPRGGDIDSDADIAYGALDAFRDEMGGDLDVEQKDAFWDYFHGIVWEDRLDNVREEKAGRRQNRRRRRRRRA